MTVLCALNRKSLLGDINREGRQPVMAEQEGRTSMLQDILDKFKIEGRVRSKVCPATEPVFKIIFHSLPLLLLQKQVIHCLVIVSRLSPNIADKRDVGVHYEKLFKSCQQRYQGEGPTGLLLVYPQHCVHLVESPWEIIIQVITDLDAMQKEQWVFL